MKSLEGKNILITGGTGFIGRPLCSSLLQSGANILLLTRRPELVEKNERLLAYSQLESIPHVEKIDVVINLAGETIAQRWNAPAKERIRDSRIGLTQHLVNFLSTRKKKPELFISGSAIGYYGYHESKIFDECTPPDKSAHDSFAAQLCKEWESAALQAQKSSIPTVILRIGAVLEKDGGILKKMYPAFFCGLGGQFGTGEQWLSWIHREDLIRLILFLIRNDNIRGPINAVSPEPITNRDFCKALAKCLNRPCLFPMPAAVVKILFGQMADEIMLAGQKIQPAEATRTGFEFHFSQVSSALNQIFDNK
jgi:uncharacterized protein (TIGR01777 family)